MIYFSGLTIIFGTLLTLLGLYLLIRGLGYSSNDVLDMISVGITSASSHKKRYSKQSKYKSSKHIFIGTLLLVAGIGLFVLGGTSNSDWVVF